MRPLQQLLDTIRQGDRVLLRGDLNVPIRNGAVGDSTRIDALLPTIAAIRTADARLILSSHLGRPDGFDLQYSLEPVAEVLSRKLATEVQLLTSPITSQETVAAISDLPHGGVALLENLRFHPGEKENDSVFAASLANLCSFYVNDAFGSCHRAHASVDAIADLRPGYAGLLLEKEISSLGSLNSDPQRPFFLLLGGSKVADKIGVIDHLSDSVDGMVVGGGMANTILHARGIPVGDSRVDQGSIADGSAKRLAEDPSLLLPIDFVCGPTLENPESTRVVQLGEDIPEGWAIFDIGPASVKLFEEALSGARTVFWNGPAGVFEEAAYQQGTRSLSEFLAQHPGKVVVGGGDSAAAARLFVGDRSFHHISTGGGAALKFLGGDTLPGIAALNRFDHPA